MRPDNDKIAFVQNREMLLYRRSGHLKVRSDLGNRHVFGRKHQQDAATGGVGQCSKSQLHGVGHWCTEWPLRVNDKTREIFTGPSFDTIWYLFI